MNTTDYTKVHRGVRFRHGAEFVCYGCCSNGRLERVESVIVWDCPDHLFMVIRDGKVVFTRTMGARQ